MAILQRTPPARRPISGTEMEPAASSPSPSRLIRTSERQLGSNADSYVFPSLESMAADRQAALSLAPRISPSIAISSRARNSVELSGGSVGTSSANSRKVLGGQVGRNAPALSATVAKLYPAIGEGRSSSIQSPRSLTKSSIPRVVPSPTKSANIDQRSSSAVSRDQSLADTFQQQNSVKQNRSSASIDTRILEGAASATEQSTFEAQMERALASGADPFQDRKKELMRGESRMPTSQQENISAPRRSFLRSAELESAEETIATEASASTPKAAPLQSPHLRSKIQKVPQSTQSPASQTSTDFVSKLKGQIEEKDKMIEEVRAEAEKAGIALEAKGSLCQQQREKIKGLERQLSEQNQKHRGTDALELRLVALEWEILRERCIHIQVRGDESRERDIDAIICRNEITYMDARRAETEFDLIAKQRDVDKLKVSLGEATQKQRQLRESLKGKQKEYDTLESERENKEFSESRSEAALKAVKREREDLEAEVKALQEKLASKEAKNHKLKQRQQSSPIRKDSSISMIHKSSPTRRTEQSDKENISPNKAIPVTTSKATRVVSETVRQSPRKKLSAFVKSTSAKIQSSVMRQSDDSLEEEEPSKKEDAAYAVKSTVGCKEVISKASSRISTRSEENDSENEMEAKKTVLPKRKGGILSRAKNAGDKKVTTTSSKRKSDNRDKEAHMSEMEREVQQTPMIPAKKKKGKAEIVRGAQAADESLDAEATPVVRPKNKQQATAKLVQDTTETPVIRSKKRKEDVERRESIEASTSATTNSKRSKAGVVEQEADMDTGVQKKKRKRVLKQSTNIANNFLNCNGDTEGGLDPELNLPLQLSPLKASATNASATTLGNNRGAASSRIFGR